MSRYRMRNMEPADLPKLLKLHQAQNERDGTSYPLPRIFGPDGRLDANVIFPLTMTRDGEPVQGIVCYTSTAEMCLTGTDPRATAHSRRHIDTLAWALRSRGFDGLRCLVPPAMAASIEKPLLRAGFKKQDFTQFFLEI